MPLNANIVDIEKPNGIRLVDFIADNIFGFFLHPSIFFN